MRSRIQNLDNELEDNKLQISSLKGSMFFCHILFWSFVWTIYTSENNTANIDKAHDEIHDKYVNIS